MRELDPSECDVVSGGCGRGWGKKAIFRKIVAIKHAKYGKPAPKAKCEPAPACEPEPEYC